MWRRDYDNAPSEAGEFFLVRLTGLYPGNGKPYIPTIVQQIDGNLYHPDNEINHIIFGHEEPIDNWKEAGMEWQPFPPDWT